LLLAVPVAALAVAATALGQSDRASGPSSAGVSGSSLLKCGKSMKIGFLAPITGPAASLGKPQVDWAQYYLSQWNKTHKNMKFQFVKEDTMLGAANGTAEAVKGAQALASNSAVLGVVGPAGSNEVKATTGALKGAGLGFVSGSATNAGIATD